MGLRPGRRMRLATKVAVWTALTLALVTALTLAPDAARPSDRRFPGTPWSLPSYRRGPT